MTKFLHYQPVLDCYKCSFFPRTVPVWNNLPLQLQIGTRVTYFTDSDTIKKCWYWSDTDANVSTQCSPIRMYVAIAMSMQTCLYGHNCKNASVAVIDIRCSIRITCVWISVPLSFWITGTRCDFKWSVTDCTCCTIITGVQCINHQWSYFSSRANLRL